MTDKDQEYMRLALKLAERGEGHVAPNPLVGAVIVKDGRIIGEGAHEQYGSLHAERNALKDCKEDPKGADIYVTLEPCCHTGKQPPCTDALIEAGIRRVFIGSEDPNPKVSGKGVRILQEHGIEVTKGLLKEECDRINESFFYNIQTGLPYVVMKYAMTLDGKIATKTGASKWVSGAASRAHVHRLRNRYTGIMAGIGTVLTDDPLLTCRMEGGRNPIRIICDSSLRTPLSSKIVQTADKVQTIIAGVLPDDTKEATEKEAFKNRKAALETAGCRVLLLPSKNHVVDLNALMKSLGQEGIDSILLEGGAALNWSAVKSGIVNKVIAYLAPKLFGGAYAKGPVSGTGFDSPEDAFLLKDLRARPLGEDLFIEAYPNVTSS